MPRAPIFRLAWRESRTARRRLALYMSSIALGVAALVAIDSFATNVVDAVHDQSRELLGGDVAVRSAQPFSPATAKLVDSVSASGVRRATSTSFSSMGVAVASGNTRLVQVIGASPGYPIYGGVTTAPARAWTALQSAHDVVVDPSLLVSLNARVGDSLSLGTARFRITGTVEKVSGQVDVGGAISPKVYVAERWLPETGLLVFGSRVSYETLLGLRAGMDPRAVARSLRSRLDTARVRVRTAEETERDLTQSVDQLRDFLGVIGLIALLLGGIGVASGIHAFVIRKIDVVAVLRCLGATSRQVLAIYLLQAGAMGLLGALAGAAIGLALQFALPFAIQDFLPVDVTVRAAPGAILLGLVIGTWVALVFALRPLVALRTVSPLQALRRESDAAALRRARRDPVRHAVTFAIVASVVALGLARADSWQRGLAFAVGIGVAIGVLSLAAWVVALLARRGVRPAVPWAIRQGLASLYRPGNQTRAVMLALGFGVFLMSTVYQVQHTLTGTLDIRLQQARANLVFFDVQPQQAAGIDSIVRSSGDHVLQQLPIVPMRIDEVNGRSSTQLLADTAHRRPRWVLTREYRSTWRDTLVPTEKITAGKWFSASHDTSALPQVSLDEAVAHDMHVSLGDTIVWNVQGLRVPTRVTSFRAVNWGRFEPNFFAVFESRALEGAPHQVVMLARVPDSQEAARVQRAVVAAYPTVSSLDLSLVQHTVEDVLHKVTTAIRFLAMLSLALAIPVLFSAVSATRRERLREAVLLKTLGATRAQIRRVMLAEYAVLGALGGLTGLVLSLGSAWALIRWVFQLPFYPALAGPLAVVALMIAVALGIALLTGREVFAQTPAAALRES